ncbi:MAG: IclR family transcriptional regulator [Methyloligellaceae bacterium]
MRKRSDSSDSGDLDAASRKNDPQFVTALARGLDILTVFRPGDRELGNQEIAERTKLPKSTVSRLLYTLTKLEFLTYNAENGKYSIGFKALQLGYTTLGIWGLTEFIHPMMKELADSTGVSIALAMPEGTMMHYIQVARPNNVIHIQMDRGARLPMTVSAIGRAHIVSLPRKEKLQVLKQIRRQQKEDWPLVKAGLYKAHEYFYKHGFVTSIGEWVKDVNSVAVPIYAEKIGARLALNLGGPSFMLPPEKLMNEYGPKLKKLAKNVEYRLSE